MLLGETLPCTPSCAPHHRYPCCGRPASNPNPVKAGLYSRGQRVLLVGEGDFTFALALAAAVGGGGIVATSFDSLSDVHSKYR